MWIIYLIISRYSFIRVTRHVDILLLYLLCLSCYCQYHQTRRNIIVIIICYVFPVIVSITRQVEILLLYQLCFSCHSPTTFWLVYIFSNFYHFVCPLSLLSTLWFFSWLSAILSPYFSLVHMVHRLIFHPARSL